jgi:hypothetical protein
MEKKRLAGLGQGVVVVAVVAAAAGGRGVGGGVAGSGGKEPAGYGHKESSLADGRGREIAQGGDNRAKKDKRSSFNAEARE